MNYPNISDQGATNPQGYQLNYHQGQAQPPYKPRQFEQQPPRKPYIEYVMDKLFERQGKTIDEINTNVLAIGECMKVLENQVPQLSNDFSKFSCGRGKLLEQPEVNPHDSSHCIVTKDDQRYKLHPYTEGVSFPHSSN